MYDAIIIGAGIGGLTTASLLQESGLNTLTVEQHTKPGGSCSYFNKKGYKFDAGASLFYGFGDNEHGGTLNLHSRLFDRLGLKLQTIHDPIQIHYHLPNNFNVCTHYNQEKFLGELIKRFPEEENGIKKFYSELDDVYQVIGSFPAGSLENLGHLLWIGKRHPKKVVELILHTFKNMGQTARKYIKNEELLKFIDIEAYSWAVRDASSTPFVNAGICLADRHHGGIHYPVGGSGAIPQALVEGIKKFGGEVVLGVKVKEILTDGKKAIGVRLESGKEIFAKTIISNATVWDTFQTLLPNSTFKDTNYRFDLAPSWFQLYLGIDASVVQKNFNVHHILVDDWNSYQQEAGTVYFSCPSILDKSVAPKGKHLLHVFTTSNFSEWKKSGTQDNAYLEQKEKLASLLIQKIERILPGVSNHIELQYSASPITHQKYLNRYKGTYGPLFRKGQYVLEKPQNHTPYKNLFHVGDSCFPGQGVIAVTYSGISCADIVLKHFKKRFRYL